MASFIEKMFRHPEYFQGWSKEQIRQDSIDCLPKKIGKAEKRRLADWIDEGSKWSIEDHSIYIEHAGAGVCGCALTLALVGSGRYGGKGKQLDFEPFEEIHDSEFAPLDYARLLDIPLKLAEKLDDLHRVQGVPGHEIAEMLRDGRL